MPSPEFNEHTEMLHESLNDLVETGATRLSSGCLVAAGLLHYRRDEENIYYRPRLVVASGAASLIRRVVQDTVQDEALIIGFMRQDDLTNNMGRIFAACPGMAKDLLQERDLEEWEIVKLGGKVHESEPEALDTDQANLYYDRLYEKLYWL